MNYYEELGVTQQATEQEIRKAHRRLVKLMHPDAQPDKNLKVLAEAQMRRLNSMVSTLLDPDQRRAYDERLDFAKTSAETEASKLTWAGIPWWFASAAGAVLLTLVAVWLWADHLGSAFGRHANQTVVISSVDSRPPLSGAEIAPLSSPSAADNRPPLSPSNGVSATLASDAPATIQKTPAAHVSRAQSEAANSAAAKDKLRLATVSAKARKPAKPKQLTAKSADLKTADSRNHIAQNAAHSPSEIRRKTFSLPSSSTLIASAAPLSAAEKMPSPPHIATLGPDHDSAPSAALPASSLPMPGAPDSPEVLASGASVATPAPRDPLEGEWVYAPKAPERRRANFYPPEYIDLKLFGSGDPGSLKGEYSAKYVVTDRPVSPEVSFELASTSRGSRKFIWQSSNGAKGTLSINPIDERTIRIDWHTTSAIREPALTSGQATLVRRQ